VSLDGFSGFLCDTESAFDIIGKEASVMAWVRTSNTDNWYLPIVTKGDSTSYDMELLFGQVHVQVDGVGATLYGASPDVRDGSWHHLCAVLVPPLNKTYVNGVLYDSETHNGNDLGLNDNPVGLGWVDGYIRQNNGTNSSLTGDMDDAAIFNKALTQAEIQNVINDGVPTSSTTTSPTTTTSTTTTTTIFTTSTTSTTSPFTGSHDVSYTYTGGYFSFELGDIDPGLAFGHGFLTPGSGDGARFDFWFAPDGVIDGSGVGGGGGATPGGNYAAGGDDVFIGSRTVNEDGVDQYMGGAGLDIDSFAATGSALTNFTGPGFADGTVAAYGRVFENDNPQAGDWYSVSASEVIRNQDVVSNPPNTIPIGRGLGIGGLDPIDGTQWSFLVSATVPPPVIVDVNTDVTLWAVYTPTGMVTPMYSTNLGTVPIEWITVPVFSNTFVTGTNVITFDPPDTNSADVHFHLLQTF